MGQAFSKANRSHACAPRPVVCIVLIERASQLAYRAFCPQTEIDAIEVPFMCLFGQRLRQLPREDFKVFFIGQAALHGTLCLPTP